MDESLSVVLASNRGPISFARAGEGFETKRGAGGMAGALDPVARRLGGDAVWIAAATSDVDRAALAAGAVDALSPQLGYDVYLLDIDPSAYQRYYDVVSNRMLWFANHCLWDELDIHDFGDDEIEAWDDSYEPVNERFARAVYEVAEPSSMVLFQDYHLTRAPLYLRTMRETQLILHFTHSSFCGPPGLERLPEPIPQKVIEGMLAANLVGFHTVAWALGFMDCCERFGGKVDIDTDSGAVHHEGRTTWIRSYPIPIDVGELRTLAGSEAARGWSERILADGPGPIVVRADRTEPSKNIVRGFEAFGMVLDRRSDLASRIRFIACLYPSRQTMPEYQTYVREVQASVDRVNQRHPGAIDLFMKDDYARTLGALRVYDVLLVNPIMDGMNLVSKEGPAINEHAGSLVLSRGAGSFAELGRDAISIDDPLDIAATADAIERALGLSNDERSARAARLRATIEAAQPEEWLQSQLDDLSAIRDTGAPKSGFQSAR